VPKLLQHDCSVHFKREVLSEIKKIMQRIDICGICDFVIDNKTELNVIIDQMIEHYGVIHEFLNKYKY